MARSLAAAAIALLSAVPAGAVTITVVSTDGAGEGFNDPTAVSPVGGNPGTTLGAQRYNCFQYAANAWGLRLAGTRTVVVSAAFNVLQGDAQSAVLGSAGPNFVQRDWALFPKKGTWYVDALANQLQNQDINGAAQPEILAQFNSAVDNQVVLGSVDFYYGFDGNAGTDIDFLTVVLHEIGHGLGFLDLLDADTGAEFFGYDDAYSVWLEDTTYTPKNLSQMSDSQRYLAIRNDGNLLWWGPKAMAQALLSLTQGARMDGRIQMFAPASYIAGSSTSHFDTDVTPNELMEPYATKSIRNLAMTTAAFEDIGWTSNGIPECGDANGDKKVNAADALAALRAAVGSYSCPLYLCNVNFVGGTTAADALAVLKYAVGQSIELVCPLI